MARRYPYLALLGALLIILVTAAQARPAAAQWGACPPGTYSLGSPSGIYPGDAIVCSSALSIVSLVNTNPETYPCSQHILHRNAQMSPEHPQQPVYIIPPADAFLGQRLRVTFFIFTRPKIPGFWIIPPGQEIDDVTLTLRYYNSSGTEYSVSSQPLSAYRRINTYYEGPGRQYYPVYIVDQRLNAAGAGGYVSARLTYGGDTDQYNHNWAMSSIKIGNEHDILPEHCQIPNTENPGPTPPPPPTPTLLPTWTPNPSATATPPPVTTPGATAPGTTPQATWTITPVIFPTTRAESTPTPWAPISLPTISWPTPQPTVVWADTGGGGDDPELGLGGMINTINNSWQPAIAAVDDWADPNSSAATGNASPVETALEMAQHVTRPVSYVKAIATYMPNLGPYILYLLMLAGFIAFNIMSRFSLSLSARILEIIRRIVELIPGM